MKYTSHFRWALAPLLAALVLAGCATPAAIDPASLPATPAAFREASTSSAPALQGPWWGVFADPVLSQLVEQASRNNNTVQIAAARLAQARAIAGPQTSTGLCRSAWAVGPPGKKTWAPAACRKPRQPW